MSRSQLATEDWHTAPDLSLQLIRPEVLLEIDLIFVFEIADVEVDRRMDIRACDVDVATTVRVGCPVGHGDVLGIVREHGVIAVIAQVESNDHQWAVLCFFEVTVPSGTELWAEGIHVLFRGPEFASCSRYVSMMHNTDIKHRCHRSSVVQPYRTAVCRYTSLYLLRNNLQASMAFVPNSSSVFLIAA